LLDRYAPEIRELVAKGHELNVHLIGAATIVPTLLPFLCTEEFMNRQHRPMRLAFSVFDRINTGEMAPWQCFSCGRDFCGLEKLSALAVIERKAGEPVPTKPAIVMPVCRSCDSSEPGETRRQLEEELARNPRRGDRLDHAHAPRDDRSLWLRRRTPRRVV
jgi:hypothetical protein